MNGIIEKLKVEVEYVVGGQGTIGRDLRTGKMSPDWPVCVLIGIV